MGCPIIMGRKTFESIGRPLPGRENIIITRNQAWTSEGCTVVHSLDQAFQAAEKKDYKEVFVIGGGEIYKQALEICDRLYLSQIDFSGEADTYFPDYSLFKWEKRHQEDFPADGDKPRWSFSILEKSKAQESYPLADFKCLIY